MKHKESFCVMMCVGMSVRSRINEECACVKYTEEEDEESKKLTCSNVRNIYNTHIFYRHISKRHDSRWRCSQTNPSENPK